MRRPARVEGGALGVAVLGAGALLCLAWAGLYLLQDTHQLAKTRLVPGGRGGNGVSDDGDGGGGDDVSLVLVAGRDLTNAPSAGPTTRDTSRMWHLNPPPSDFLNPSASMMFSSKPLCQYGELGRKLCSLWIDSATEFRDRKTAVRWRRKDQINSWWRRKHARCPENADQAINVWLRDWNSGWNHVLDGIITVPDCPVKCQATPWEPRGAAVIVDTNTLSGTPRVDSDDTSPLQALLELTSNVHMNGPRVRARDMKTADMLISYSRLADVWVNYMYGWEECTTPEEVRLGKKPDIRKWDSFQEHFDRCLPPPPTLLELVDPVAASVKLGASAVAPHYGRRDFLVGFVQGTCDDVAPTTHEPPGRWRGQYVKELLEALVRRQKAPGRHVVNYGSCHPRSGGPGAPPYVESWTKVQLFKRFKFSLAFEAEWRHDLITEQAFQSVIAGTIPIVFAGPEAGEFLPGGEGSFINALDFPSPDALAKFLVELDQDHARYLRYFDWRWDTRTMNPRFPIATGFAFSNSGRDSLVCRVCSVFAREWCGVDVGEVHV